MSRFVDKYQSHLFPQGRSLSSEVVLAYQQKIFDKFLKSISSEASFEYPGMIKVDYNDRYSMHLNIDMSYVVKDTDDVTRTIYGFVILVPEDNWNPIDLSNRFERPLIARHLYPKLKEENDTFSSYEIVYFNPKNGKSYTVKGIHDYKGLNADLNRMEYTCDRIVAKDFTKRPVHQLCKACNVLDKCMPRDYGKGAETVLADPLKLD